MQQTGLATREQAGLPAELTPEQVAAMVDIEAASDANAYHLVPSRMTFKGGAFTIEGTEFARVKIRAAVLISKVTRGLWLDEEEKRPTCTSSDGVNGAWREDESTTLAVKCLGCRYNAWASDLKGGKGKACGEFRTLLLRFSEIRLPVLLRLPVTSIKGWDKYCSTIGAVRGQAYFTVLTEFSLDKQELPGMNRVWYVAEETAVAPLPLDEVMDVLRARRDPGLTAMFETAQVADLEQGPIDHEGGDLPFDGPPPSDNEGPTIEEGAQNEPPF